MKKAKALLILFAMIATISASFASKARMISMFYAPSLHAGPCYITTFLFLTTTYWTLGDAYEIARNPTSDSCVEFCVGFE